jgi:hypothetical protein
MLKLAKNAKLMLNVIFPSIDSRSYIGEKYFVAETTAFSI